MQKFTQIKAFVSQHGDPLTILNHPPPAISALTAKSLKKAYKEQALIYHPDKNSSKDAISQFNVIKQAYDFMSQNV